MRRLNLDGSVVCLDQNASERKDIACSLGLFQSDYESMIGKQMRSYNLISRYSAKYSIIISSLLFFTCVFSTHGEEINYKKLYLETAPAVVLIYGTDGQTAARGTGTIIDQGGLVLTNTHVVVHESKRWKRLFVFLKPETVTGNSEKDLTHGHLAEVLAINPEYDLALVQIVKPPADLPVLPLSDLSKVGIGESTVAIGHPSGGAFWTLTTGRISASWTNYNTRPGWDIFQTETSLNPGNSGGPLLDGSGAVVGVNTFIIRKDKGGTTLTGLNFAVKSTTARKWIVQVIGKLPPASVIRKKEEIMPDKKNVETAKAPGKKASKPESFYLQSPSSRKRDTQLAEPSERKDHYTHSPKFKTGTEFTARKLMFLKQFQKVNTMFEKDDFFK
jgi:serine protease Do